MRGVDKCMLEDAGAYKRGPGAPLAPQVQRANLFQQPLLSPIEVALALLPPRGG